MGAAKEGVTAPRLCACGCGLPAPTELSVKGKVKSIRHGHWNRLKRIDTNPAREATRLREIAARGQCCAMTVGPIPRRCMKPVGAYRSGELHKMCAGHYSRLPFGLRNRERLAEASRRTARLLRAAIRAEDAADVNRNAQ